MNKLNQFVNDETGIQHAEEALLLALIAVALIGGVKALTTGINGVFGAATGGMAPFVPA